MNTENYNREAAIQHAIDILCDVVPHNDPDYANIVRGLAESFVDNYDELGNLLQAEIDKIADKIRLDCTCGACPEQYDMFIDDTQIGYIRYRWGYLACRPCNNDGMIDWDKTVFEWEHPDDGWSGIIPEDQRDTLLQRCKNAIAKYIWEGAEINWDETDDTEKFTF